MSRFFAYGIAAALMALGLAAPVSAQTSDAAAAEESPPPELDSSDPASSGRLDDEQALAEDDLGGTEEHSAASPFEEEHKEYYFLGVSYRHTWTPEFLMKLFLDERTPATNHGVSLEFTYRKDAFEIITQLSYQTFFVNGPFRGKGDDILETEFIDSELRAAFLGASFLWSTMFTDWIGLEYGLDIGIGGVWGDLHRNEAYETRATGNVDGWTACDGAGDFNGGAYCEPGGNYGIEDSWIGGGSRPVVWARLAPHLAVRFKPMHQLVFRIDGGFDLFSGFFLGGAAAFGF